MYWILTEFFKGYGTIVEMAQLGEISGAINIALLFLLISLAVIFSLIVYSVVKRKIIRIIRLDVRDDLFRSVFSHKPTDANYESIATTELVNDIDTLEESYYNNILELFGDSIQIIAMAIALVQLGTEFLLTVLILMIPSLVVPLFSKNRLSKATLDQSNAYEEYNKWTKQSLDSFDVYKIFDAEKVAIADNERVVKKLEKSNIRLGGAKTINGLLLVIAVYIIKAGAQLYFTYSAITGVIATASVATLFVLSNSIGNPIASIIQYISAIQSTKLLRTKLIAVIYQTNGVKKSNKTAGDNPKEQITLEPAGVTFAYDQATPILRDISTTFLPDTKYLILGKSGSGKSTLFRLLAKQENTYQGKILLNNIELREVDDRVVYSNTSWIRQDTYIFSGSLRDNITMLDEHVGDDIIMNSIDRAGLTDWYNGLSEGLDTLIGSKGTQPSCGEKQRIAIARALCKSKSLLLLDEAFSALDNQTSIMLEEEVLSLSGVTVLSIAHRVSHLASRYDYILIIEDGMLVFRGSYLELTQNEALYKTYLQTDSEVAS
jgi:ABC-type multidrug transport system fused ATPase/permease subunit